MCYRTGRARRPSESELGEHGDNVLPNWASAATLVCLLRKYQSGLRRRSELGGRRFRRLVLLVLVAFPTRLFQRRYDLVGFVFNGPKLLLDFIESATKFAVAATKLPGDLGKIAAK